METNNYKSKLNKSSNILTIITFITGVLLGIAITLLVIAVVITTITK